MLIYCLIFYSAHPHHSDRCEAIEQHSRMMRQGQRARQKYDKEEEEKQRGRKLMWRPEWSWYCSPGCHERVRPGRHVAARNSGWQSKHGVRSGYSLPSATTTDSTRRSRTPEAQLAWAVWSRSRQRWHGWRPRISESSTDRALKHRGQMFHDPLMTAGIQTVFTDNMKTSIITANATDLCSTHQLAAWSAHWSARRGGHDIVMFSNRGTNDRVRNHRRKIRRSDLASFKLWFEKTDGWTQAWDCRNRRGSTSALLRRGRSGPSNGKGHMLWDDSMQTEKTGAEEL